jgi:signal transduction histidine kinase
MPVKILVVDDEPNLEPLILQIFRREIRQEEFDFVFALNGVEALDKLQAEPEIDVLLTDIRMPKMDGLTLLAKLNELQPSLNPVLTAVIMSAYDDMGNIRKAMNLGAFDFLTKPIDYQDLRITLDKTIQHVRQLKRALEQERMIQDALRRANEELERRVEERTAQLLEVNASLKASNLELDAFAHTVAHDLKNPLALIVGYVQVLEMRLAEMETPDEMSLELVKNINQGGQQAARIIDELMLLAGVRKGKAKIAPIAMAVIISRVRQRLAFLIEEYQAKLVLASCWPVVLGYEQWVEEVWANYISNGIKYGGRPPHLELGASTQTDGVIRFWVRDNGPGITPEVQATLFTEFTRLDEVRAEGHGLGLSIARRIVEKLGGQVGVESEVGQGSVFYFTLPSADQ